MDHLLDLDEKLDLANAAAAALKVEPGPMCALCAKWSRILTEICRTSSMTPKSTERRHTNGAIASRKRRPTASSPATKRARMKAARSQGRAEDS